MPEAFASEILIVAAIFLVAVLYSSVGHGGASGYLAVMALLGVAATVTRPTALTLNLFVSSIAFVQFYRARHFEWNIFLPFAVGSIPLAYLGGSIHLPTFWYRIILGVTLIFAAIRLAINLKTTEEPRAPKMWVCLLTGAFLGLISGLVGVGGGIFLTPILLLMNWTETKKAAGISALFILVNSISGLFGNRAQILEMPSVVWIWIAAAVIGGIIGSRFGSYRFNSLTLRRVLASGLIVAGLRLLFT